MFSRLHHSTAEITHSSTLLPAVWHHRDARRCAPNPLSTLTCSTSLVSPWGGKSPNTQLEHNTLSRSVTGKDSALSGHASSLQLPLYTMTHFSCPASYVPRAGSGGRWAGPLGRRAGEAGRWGRVGRAKRRPANRRRWRRRRRKVAAAAAAVVHRPGRPGRPGRSGETRTKA